MNTLQKLREVDREMQAASNRLVFIANTIYQEAAKIGETDEGNALRRAVNEIFAEANKLRS